MKKPIIEFKNVSKVFEDSGTVVLKDINFELEEGKFYTLLGASGSGKSTILNIIAGLLDATFDLSLVTFFKRRGKATFSKTVICGNRA